MNIDSPNNIRQEQSKMVDTIIDEYYEAIGGYNKLKSINSKRLQGDYHEGELDLNFNLYWKRPNIRSVNWQLGDIHGAEGFDGNISWEINHKTENKEAQKLSGEKAAAARRGAEFDESFVDFKEKNHQVEYIGDEIIEDVLAHVLKVTLSDGWIKDYYFDVQTNLLVGLKKSMPFHGEGDPITSITLISNYQSVNGVLFAYEFQEKNIETGEIMNFGSWENIEVNIDIDENLYLPPNDVVRDFPI